LEVFFLAEAVSEADRVGLDLFGHPVRPLRDPRGRPSFAKSKENQMLVMTLRARGWSHAQIAAFMGCDDKTLRKHFSRELEHGALFLEGIAMQALVRKMEEGHVGATKEVLAITKAAVAPTGQAKPKPAAPIGKKETLRRDAEAPPTSWGDLLN
jgi:AraC-like DNA-binding protein